MKNERLSAEERELLERYHDDDLSEFEARRAEKLMESSEVAAEYVAALHEVGDATRIAEEEAWQKADAPAAHVVAESVFASRGAEEASLEELAPLLERFFDGETTDEEAAWVAELIDERDEAAEYLMGLESMQAGVRVSSEAITADVDFGGFWEGVASRIDAAAPSDDSFEIDDHAMLLQRFHDQEVDDAEIARVNGWVDEEVPDVIDTIDALSELKLAVNAGIEHAQEGVDFGSIWEAVEDAMDEDLEQAGDGKIVAFGKRKRQREKTRSGYSQLVVGAVAALFLVAFVGGIFNEQIFGPNEVRVVEKTVVIVDSVEYAPGSSVMIDSPVQEASAKVAAEGSDTEEPTVIWLLDSGEEDLENSEEAPGEEAPEADEAKENEETYKGQPI